MQAEIDAFHSALERPAGEREAYLQTRYGEDPELVTRVLRLLEAHEDVERDGLAPEERFAGADDVPATIGPYRIVAPIGAGGMGIVYEAEQSVPIRRRVALKVLKRGMDTEEVLLRFEAERQALALMDHPGIARILDAGASEDGRPYFAMELVDGQPLTDHCTASGASLEVRLAVFSEVCRAVEHAHRRGIIHRDLKPSNVLVTMHEGRARPKVIDFGIAKATAAPLTDEPFATRHGGVVGTPEYMSPEQSGGAGAAVDTRSDVFSLGVILYELLTGTLPIDPAVLAEGGIEAFKTRLREVDPPRPSTRLTGSPAAIGLDAARVASMARRVRGDLDWIVLRALARDPERRYPSASAFVEDIERYLQSRPIEARPPSAGYVLRKFVRRHRVMATLVGLGALSLLLGLGGLAIGLVRAHRAEGLANRRAEAAQASADFLEKVLFQVDPEYGSSSLTIAEVLENAGSWVGEELGAFPVVEASTRESIGVTFRRRSMYAQAAPHLERSLELRLQHLGDAHLDTAAAHIAMANLFFERDGAFEGALAHLEAARGILVRNGLDGGLPGAWLDLDVGLVCLAADRLPEAKVALERCRAAMVAALGADHADVSRPLRGLAALALIEGDLERAADLSSESLTVATRQEAGYLIARAQLVRAAVFGAQGRTSRATFQLAICRDILDRRVGQQHIRWGELQAGLAGTHLAGGRFEAAQERAAACLALREGLLAPTHWLLVDARLLQARAALGLGRLDEARASLDGADSVDHGLPADHRLLVEAARLRRDLEQAAGDDAAARRAAGALEALEASRRARLGL